MSSSSRNKMTRGHKTSLNPEGWEENDNEAAARLYKERNKPLSGPQEDFDEFFPHDQFTQSTNRVLYDGRGKILSIMTTFDKNPKDYYARKRGQKDCPIENPWGDQLEDPEVMEVLKEWFRSSLGRPFMGEVQNSDTVTNSKAKVKKVKDKRTVGSSTLVNLNQIGEADQGSDNVNPPKNKKERLEDLYPEAVDYSEFSDSDDNKVEIPKVKNKANKGEAPQAKVSGVSEADTNLNKKRALSPLKDSERDEKFHDKGRSERFDKNYSNKRSPPRTYGVGRGNDDDASESSQNSKRERSDDSVDSRYKRRYVRDPGYSFHGRDKAPGDKDRGNSRLEPDHHDDRFDRNQSNVIAAAQIKMLDKLSKGALETWSNNMRVTRLGVRVRHVEYINPSLFSDISIYTAMRTKFDKPPGDWTSWSLEDLVKVLNATNHRSEETKFIGTLEALKDMDWEQSTSDLSIQGVMDQMQKVRKTHGDIDLSNDELTALINEIKRKLRSDKVREEDRNYNKNIAEMLDTNVKKKMINTLTQVVVAIGDYNQETRDMMEAVIARLGHVGHFRVRDRKPTPKPDGYKRKDQRDNNAPSKKPKTDQRAGEGAESCKGCGRFHKGDCEMRNHPNWNKSSKPWAESEMGKAFLALKEGESWTKLPVKFQLSKDQKKLDPYNPKERYKKLKVFSINLNNTVNNEQATTKWIPKGLIDSGALNGGPYVDYKLAMKLFKFNKNSFNIVNTKKVKISVPFGGLSNCNTSIRLCIQLSHKNNSVMINEDFIVAKDLGHDVIIDEDTIKKYQLTRVFDDYFTDVKSKENVNFNICDCNHCETCQEPRPAGAGSAGIPHPPSIAAAIKLDSLDSHDHGEEFTEVHIKDLLPTEEDVDDGLDHESFMDNLVNRQAINKSKDDYLKCKIQGEEDLQTDVKELVFKYKRIFRKTLVPEPAFLEPMVLKVDEEKWRLNKNRQPRRPYDKNKRKAINDFVELALENDLIELSQAEYWSQVHLEKKPDDTWRFCIDFRNLNLASEGMGWPLPNIMATFRRVGDRCPKIFSTMDFTQGYYQIALSAESRKYTAFRTDKGLYQWKRLPMGLKGACSFFQNIMATVVLSDMLEQECELYIDDILQFGDDKKSYLEGLEKIFIRCVKYNIFLNPEKCSFGLEKVVFLGHVMDRHGLHFTREKLEKVINFPMPITQKQLKSFLGICGYFRSHIIHYSELTYLLNEEMRGYEKKKAGKKIMWNDESTAAFHNLVKAIDECPKLMFLNETDTIEVFTDASKYGIGGIIYQIVEGKREPIAILSKSLTISERKWMVEEKEAYAIYVMLRKYDYLLRGRKFTVYSDHRNFIFLRDSKKEKVVRWRIEVQSFDFTIKYIKGSENVIADAFSRMCVNEEEEGVKESVINAFKRSSYKRSIDIEKVRIPSQKYKLIGSFHNTVAGHRGIDTTIRLLKEQGHSWNDMKIQVEAFIKKCPICQKNSDKKNDSTLKPFTLASTKLMHRIAVDTIVNVGTDKDGYKHLIVIIDTFSRHVELYKCKDLTTTSAVEALVDWVCRFGAPAEIVSDNGSQYVAELIEELMEFLQIDHLPIQPYSHEENGIVERANKEIRRHIRNIITKVKDKSKWTEYIPLVRRIINASIHSSTGFRPSEMLFGNLIDLNKSLLPSNDEEKNKHFIQKRNDEICKLAAKSQKDLDAQNKADRNPRKFTEFLVGDFVLANPKGGTPESKLHPRKLGPFKVIERKGNVYILENCITNKHIDYHVKNLYPFLFDKVQTDPADVAKMDDEMYDVLKVENHTFIGNKRKTKDNLELFMQFEDDKEPKWYSWNKSYNDVQVIQEYLKDNDLKHFVLDRYK